MDKSVEWDDINCTVAMLANVAISCPVFHAKMATDCHPIMVLHHHVTHQNIVKHLLDAQCPDYMLQKVLELAYNAKLEGFDFNPRAMTRKAYIVDIQRFDALTDHEKAQDVVCFDFVPSLLSLLQDESFLMVTESLVCTTPQQH